MKERAKKKRERERERVQNVIPKLNSGEIIDAAKEL